jgi:GrpB-like predicted nucleotidyltransferase (UPF0157 family)
VPGLAAKPIIDIAVGVRQFPPNVAQIEALEKLGYVYLGEAGIPRQHFFRKGMPSTHHIHLAKLDSEFWERHIIFRDFLRTHLNAVQTPIVVRHLRSSSYLHRQGHGSNLAVSLATHKFSAI